MDTTRVVRLVPGRDPPAVVDLPHDLVTASDAFSHPHEGVAVLIDRALPAPAARWRFDTVADEFLPEGHCTRALYGLRTL